MEEKTKRVDDCYGIELILQQAEKKVNNNSKALEILRTNCLQLVNANVHDFTGDGKEDVAMVTSKAECNNCSQNRIYIVSENEIIFQKDSENVELWPFENRPGFAIRYPLRKQGEALCCPTESIKESYDINTLGEKYNNFYKYDEHYEAYKY